MIEDRRNFLARMAPLAIVAPFGFLSTTRAEQDGTAGPERHRQSQQPGLPEEPLPQIDSKEILKHNQQQIQDDIKKLYALAGELKAEIEKTDSANVLSLPLIRKAKEIEDLAKQIRNLATG